MSKIFNTVPHTNGRGYLEDGTNAVANGNINTNSYNQNDFDFIHGFSSNDSINSDNQLLSDADPSKFIGFSDPYEVYTQGINVVEANEPADNISNGNNSNNVDPSSFIGFSDPYEVYRQGINVVEAN